MATLAALVKHLHVWLVVLSVGGFMLRFIWSQKNSPYLQQKWVKVAPHILDTFLLLSGVSLALLYRLSPFQVHWLGAKLVLIVVYIIIGYIALKSPLSKPARQVAACLAMGTVFGIIYLAVNKPFFW